MLTKIASAHYLFSAPASVIDAISFMGNLHGLAASVFVCIEIRLKDDVTLFECRRWYGALITWPHRARSTILSSLISSFSEDRRGHAISAHEVST